MKLLFDENLSPRLIGLLSDIFPDSVHVRDVNLSSASDDDVWKYAGDHDFAIVSKDSDFHQRSFLLVNAPKAIWIQVGNCSTAQLEEILRSRVEVILEFEQEAAATFLAIS